MTLALLSASIVVSGALADRKVVVELADQERAFAKMGAEVGVRESFLHWFSEDAISFEGGPGNAHERLKARPAQATRTHKLIWGPVWADVAASGNLGYTFGPTHMETIAGERVPGPGGHYFSVWRRSEGKPWRVLLDVGTLAHIAPGEEGSFKGGRKPEYDGPPDGEANHVRKMEEAFGRSALSKGYLKVLLDVPLDKEVHVLRNGFVPAFGSKAAQELFGKETRTLTDWKVMGWGAAKTGDFGYSYGTFAFGEEDGSFVRVWRRDKGGKWRLAADVLSPNPPKG